MTLMEGRYTECALVLGVACNALNGPPASDITGPLKVWVRKLSTLGTERTTSLQTLANGHIKQNIFDRRYSGSNYCLN
ncbi:MAG: hypothetical protein NVS1B11_12960 [Terriglobales bacterium]